MDYIIGFIFGYFIKETISYIKNLSEIKLPNNYVKEDWDWIE